jgi:hypothetical protein
MNRKRANLSIFLSLFLISFLLPLELRSEYYGYVDKEGKRYFVDREDKIPLEYRDTMRVYKEKYDDLSEKERSIRLEEERRELETGPEGVGAGTQETGDHAGIGMGVEAEKTGKETNRNQTQAKRGAEGYHSG